MDPRLEGVAFADSEKLASPDTLILPEDNIQVVEHPCIVQNLDRAIKSLGGQHLIESVSGYFFLSSKATHLT